MPFSCQRWVRRLRHMNSTAWERWENQGIAARTTFWRATPKPGNFSKIKVPKSLLTTIVFQCLLVLVVDSVGDRMGILQQTVLRSRTSLASRAAAIGSATTKATSSDDGSDNRSEEPPEAKPEGNLVPTKRRLRRHSRGRWGRTPSHEGSGRLRSSPGLGRWVRSSHVTPPQTNMAARVSSLCVRLRRLRLERSGSSPRHRNAHLEPWLEYTVTSTVTVHLV